MVARRGHSLDNSSESIGARFPGKAAPLEFRSKNRGMQDRQRVALVEQWGHMKADQFVVARVSSETKARLRALAHQQHLSESAFLRRLVELVLLKAGLSPIITQTPIGVGRKTARLMIRLRPDDQILLRDRAAARGMPAEELLALKHTLGELGSIGRNLNQIAHAANLGQVVTSPGRNDLEAMLRVCKTLRDSLKGVLLANLKSWERG